MKKILIPLVFLAGFVFFLWYCYDGQRTAQARWEHKCLDIARQLYVARLPPAEQTGAIAQLEEQQRLLGCKELRP